MAVNILKNVRAVLKNRVIDCATIAIEDGIIIGIEEGRTYDEGIDCFGAFCLPGLIDTHSDAIEEEVSPRPTVTIDPAFALRSLESQLVAAGITTVCHGITFVDCDIRGRTVNMAEKLVKVIGERRRNSNPPIDHRVLFRIAMRSARGLDSTIERLDVGKMPHESALVALEDHVPGHGPFQDANKFRQYIVKQTGIKGKRLDDLIASEIKKSIAYLPQRETCIKRFSEFAKSGHVRLLAHDCENEYVVENARRWGTSVAEFPLTVDAARYAIEHDMLVVLGSPNVLRGKSHSGFVSACELIQLGLCTSLASDYLPYSLLASAFLLAEKKILPLYRAVQLITSGAASVLDIKDRGEISVGLRADIILVVMDGRWPRVLRTFRANPIGEFDVFNGFSVDI